MSSSTHGPLVGEVERRIREALEASAQRDAPRISVDVEDECAILRGAVRSWAEHEDAALAALSTPGVTKVDNRLALLVKAKPSKR
jgi:osmotically-inducible protein OsmY